MSIIGYIRVSTEDQNTARQLDGIDLDKVFIDKISGKNTDRPELQKCLDYIREGDTLVCHSMDRLARNLDDLRRIVKTLTQSGIEVRFIKENLTFTGDDSPMSNLLLSVMGAFAEFERSMIRERQLEGIAIAKTKGIYKGRQPSLTNTQIEEIRAMLDHGIPKSVVARKFHVSRQTIYNLEK